MRIEAHAFADGVDLVQQVDAAAMVACPSCILRLVHECRMVMRDDDGPGVLLVQNTLQLRGQEIELQVGHARPASPLAGEDSGLQRC